MINILYTPITKDKFCIKIGSLSNNLNYNNQTPYFVNLVPTIIDNIDVLQKTFWPTFAGAFVNRNTQTDLFLHFNNKQYITHDIAKVNVNLFEVFNSLLNSNSNDLNKTITSQKYFSKYYTKNIVSLFPIFNVITWSELKTELLNFKILSQNTLTDNVTLELFYYFYSPQFNNTIIFNFQMIVLKNSTKSSGTIIENI